jgi:hypothetical protein
MWGNRSKKHWLTSTCHRITTRVSLSLSRVNEDDALWTKEVFPRTQTEDEPVAPPLPREFFDFDNPTARDQQLSREQLKRASMLHSSPEYTYSYIRSTELIYDEIMS